MARRMKANKALYPKHTHAAEHDETPGCAVVPLCEPACCEVPDTGTFLVVDGVVQEGDNLRRAGYARQGFESWLVDVPIPKPVFFEADKVYTRESRHGTYRFEVLRVDEEIDTLIAYGRLTSELADGTRVRYTAMRSYHPVWKEEA